MLRVYYDGDECLSYGILRAAIFLVMGLGDDLVHEKLQQREARVLKL